MLFQGIAKGYLGAFLCKVAHFRHVFRICLPALFLIYLLVFVCSVFQPIALWSSFPVKMPLLALFFRFTCLFAKKI